MSEFLADPHADFVIAAYGVWLVLLLGMIGLVWRQHRRNRRQP
jgi:heme exporter protein CcmD